MTVSEAQTILLLYRPGTVDTDDPQMAEALALAKNNPELARWLEAHLAAQWALRAKFKQITPPPGLKEQIISEHAAGKRVAPKQPAVILLAVVALLLLAGTFAIFWVPHTPPADTLADYQTNMVSIALRGYAMDVMTNDLAPIRTYLAQKQSPANFNLPAPLQNTTLMGCSVEHWQNSNVSMVCFHTGKPRPPGAPSDLWLFVLDRSSVKNAPVTATPQFVKISTLTAAIWTEGDKLYLLGIEGNEADLKPYL